ncbi:MAG: amidohydrolase family protein [Bryobacterales bacterium]|nr:amidohydrolase family protein [Bryobacterales bacterium]MBV9398248.1 amidohydrolase family protein [Bryobacterales bacterium]
MGSHVIVEGIDLDLDELQIMPGLVNAHDHLHFSLFPRLGLGPYENATEWARDIYHPDREPVRSHLAVPKSLRLIWGGLRNLLAGVTTVCHHDEYHPAFDSGFPIRVVKRFGWAHSLAFTEDVRGRFETTPADQPFIIHLAEGTDADAAGEIFKLHELGALTERTVVVHAVGLTAEGWDLLRRAGAAAVWCPRSNLFTVGRTLPRQVIDSGVRIALGTDSSLTSEGDFLDEIQFAKSMTACARKIAIQGAHDVLRTPKHRGDWIATRRFGEAPELVVIDGEIRLISPKLAKYLPQSVCECFHRIQVEDRPAVLVRWDVPALLEETSRYLNPIRLAGRLVCGAGCHPAAGC